MRSPSRVRLFLPSRPQPKKVKPEKPKLGKRHPWQLVALKGHTGTIHTAKFTGCGKYAVTSADDRSIRFCIRDLGLILTVYPVVLGSVPPPHTPMLALGSAPVRCMLIFFWLAIATRFN